MLRIWAAVGGENLSSRVRVNRFCGIERKKNDKLHTHLVPGRQPVLPLGKLPLSLKRTKNSDCLFADL